MTQAVDFQGFWTDKDSAAAEVDSLLGEGKVTAETALHLNKFIRDGFVVLEDAISSDLADRLVEEINATAKHPDKFLARTNRKNYSEVDAETINDKAFRLIDFPINCAEARQAQFAPKIRDFLSLVFREELLAFQSLTFKYGSQQGIHQDGAYVVVSDPIKFAASWIALEDVTEGSGELIYYPGSHKFPHYLFSDRYKSWLPKRDGQDAGQNFISHLKTQINEKGLQETRFLPKKGDALIWAADLVHGGAKLQQDHTRYSLVTHYCPLSVKPNYTRFFEQFCPVKYTDDCWYSSRHYDLNPLAPRETTSKWHLWKKLLGGIAKGRRDEPEYASGDLLTPIFRGQAVNVEKQE